MMDELLKKLAAKGKPAKMSDEETKAKLEVVQELLQMAQEAMADHTKSGLDSLMAPKQSVEVMAEDQEGLAEGLDVAKDMVESEDLEDMEDKPEMKLDPEMEDADEETEDEEDDKPKKSAFPSLL